MLFQEEKLSHTIFFLQWNDFVRDVFVFVCPLGGMMFFDMFLYL
jgi:hypothetical protein